MSLSQSRRNRSAADALPPTLMTWHDVYDPEDGEERDQTDEEMCADENQENQTGPHVSFNKETSEAVEYLLQSVSRFVNRLSLQQVALSFYIIPLLHLW